MNVNSRNIIRVCMCGIIFAIVFITRTVKAQEYDSPIDMYLIVDFPQSESVRQQENNNVLINQNRWRESLLTFIFEKFGGSEYDRLKTYTFPDKLNLPNPEGGLKKFIFQEKQEYIKDLLQKPLTNYRYYFNNCNITQAINEVAKQIGQIKKMDKDAIKTSYRSVAIIFIIGSTHPIVTGIEGAIDNLNTAIDDAKYWKRDFLIFYQPDCIADGYDWIVTMRRKSNWKDQELTIAPTEKEFTEKFPESFFIDLREGPIELKRLEPESETPLMLSNEKVVCMKFEVIEFPYRNYKIPVICRVQAKESQPENADTLGIDETDEKVYKYDFFIHHVGEWPMVIAHSGQELPIEFLPFNIPEGMNHYDLKVSFLAPGAPDGIIHIENPKIINVPTIGEKRITIRPNWRLVVIPYDPLGKRGEERRLPIKTNGFDKIPSPDIIVKTGGSGPNCVIDECKIPDITKPTMGYLAISFISHSYHEYPWWQRSVQSIIKVGPNKDRDKNITVHVESSKSDSIETRCFLSPHGWKYIERGFRITSWLFVVIAFISCLSLPIGSWLSLRRPYGCYAKIEYEDGGQESRCEPIVLVRRNIGDKQTGFEYVTWDLNKYRWELQMQNKDKKVKKSNIQGLARITPVGKKGKNQYVEIEIIGDGIKLLQLRKGDEVGEQEKDLNKGDNRKLEEGQTAEFLMVDKKYTIGLQSKIVSEGAIYLWGKILFPFHKLAEHRRLLPKIGKQRPIAIIIAFYLLILAGVMVSGLWLLMNLNFILGKRVFVLIALVCGYIIFPVTLLFWHEYLEPLKQHGQPVQKLISYCIPLTGKAVELLFQGFGLFP